MIATVINVDPNGRVASHDTVKLTVRNEESGKESFYHVFRKGEMAEYARDVETLNSGDRIDMTVKKNGKFFNYAGHKLLPAAKSDFGGGSGGNGQDEFRRSKEEMRRNECLQAAVKLVAANLSENEPTMAAAEVALKIAPMFETYLANGVDLSALMSGDFEDDDDDRDGDVPD